MNVCTKVHISMIRVSQEKVNLRLIALGCPPPRAALCGARADTLVCPLARRDKKLREGW